MGGSPNATVLGSLTGQKREKETEINVPPCSHGQVSFSLLYNHLSASVPRTTADLWTCSRAGLQVLLLLFLPPCISIPLSSCPSQPLLPSCPNLSDFQPSLQCSHCNISMCRMEQQKAGGNSWGHSCTRSFGPTCSRGSTFGAYEEVMLQKRKHFQIQAALTCSFGCVKTLHGFIL